MAFPGDRLWKMRVSITEGAIYGAPSHDLWVVITHAVLPTAFLTLNDDQAPQDGGTDIAASLDSLGETQIPCWVTRCELNATPANSRVEIWVRRQDVSDTLDTDIYLWWGSTVETAPAVNANYGRNDVFGSTTGSGTPLSAWGVWHFDESQGDPTPQIIDATGNGHNVTSGGAPTRVDAPPGRGWQQTSNGASNTTASGTFAPGTGAFSLIAALQFPGSGSELYHGGDGGAFFNYSATLMEVYIDSGYDSGNGAGTSQTLTSLVRNGNTITWYYGTSNQSFTGWSARSLSTANPWLMNNNARATVGFLAWVNDDINTYWHRALYECIYNPATFWDVGDIEAAAVATTITIHCIDSATLADVVGARVYVLAGAVGDLTEGDELANDVTDANGELDFIISIGTDQGIEGWSRKGTATPFYKQGIIQGTISPGIDVTLEIPMTRDE